MDRRKALSRRPLLLVSAEDSTPSHSTAKEGTVRMARNIGGGGKRRRQEGAEASPDLEGCTPATTCGVVHLRPTGLPCVLPLYARTHTHKSCKQSPKGQPQGITSARGIWGVGGRTFQGGNDMDGVHWGTAVANSGSCGRKATVQAWRGGGGGAKRGSEGRMLSRMGEGTVHAIKTLYLQTPAANTQSALGNFVS
eukprot:EG_transcript_19602